MTLKKIYKLKSTTKKLIFNYVACVAAVVAFEIVVEDIVDAFVAVAMGLFDFVTVAVVAAVAFVAHLVEFVVVDLNSVVVVAAVVVAVAKYLQAEVEYWCFQHCLKNIYFIFKIKTKSVRNTHGFCSKLISSMFKCVINLSLSCIAGRNLLIIASHSILFTSPTNWYLR